MHFGIRASSAGGGRRDMKSQGWRRQLASSSDGRCDDDEKAEFALPKDVEKTRKMKTKMLKMSTMSTT